MSLFLTFDIGTTALKTALVDGGGQVQAVHTEEYEYRSPQPGWGEAEPNLYWDAARKGVSAVFAGSGLAPSELTAIGFSSQGQTFIPITRKGQPLYDAIVWVDNRAREVVDKWQKEWLTKEYYRRISGYPWIPAELTLFKIAWLRQHAPEALDAWKFLCLPDYFIYRLTGETVTDYTTAQSAGLFDIATGTWEPDLLSRAGISEDQLPRVVPPGTVVGAVRNETAVELGVPAGLPVCVGVNDQLAGAIGAGNVSPGLVSETTGTALAVVATTGTLLDDMHMFVGRHAVPGLSYAMPFAITSAIVLKWFRDICSQEEDYDSFLAGIDEVPAGCDGLTVLPHFSGTASPTFNPDVRGVFSGLSLSHTRAHIARAIMESCACVLKECLDVVRNHEISITIIRSLGGAARSELWLQIKADMLGIPIERPACSDAASLGAAMLAAAGVGQFSGVAQASEAWYRPARILEPNPVLHSRYEDVYGRYLMLYERLYGKAKGACDVLSIS